jgi:hypothetical protein
LHGDALDSIDLLTTNLHDRLSVRGEPQDNDYAAKGAVLAWFSVQVRMNRTPFAGTVPARERTGD